MIEIGAALVVTMFFFPLNQATVYNEKEIKELKKRVEALETALSEKSHQD